MGQLCSFLFIYLILKIPLLAGALMPNAVHSRCAGEQFTCVYFIFVALYNYGSLEIADNCSDGVKVCNRSAGSWSDVSRKGRIIFTNPSWDNRIRVSTFFTGILIYSRV